MACGVKQQVEPRPTTILVGATAAAAAQMRRQGVGERGLQRFACALVHSTPRLLLFLKLSAAEALDVARTRHARAADATAREGEVNSRRRAQIT